MLNVGDCDLEALPAELGTACRELEELYAFGNKLVGALPESLGTLPKLRVLHLDNNVGLTALPHAIAQLAQLDGTVDHGDGKWHCLVLDGCTGLVAPPHSVVEGKRYTEQFAAVRDWFVQQQHDGGGGGGGGGD